MLRGTLSFRITVLLVGSFVFLQLAVFAMTGLVPRDRHAGSLGLPSVAQLRAMTELVEALPPDRRPAAITAFDGALYRVLIEEGPLPATVESARGMDIGKLYSSGLPGHRLSVTGNVARLPMLTRINPWPGWLRDPLAIHVALAGERPSMLTIESQPSEPVRALLRQRAAFLGLGGLVALIALALAVRATTQPIARLARDIRAYRGAPDSPDLVVGSSPELRDLAQAYNEMKARIAELVSERTRVLAAIAHDMRTYITRIRLRAEFIDDPDQHERAVADLDEMAALLDDTLLLARAEAHGVETTKQIDLALELRRMADIRQEMGEAVTVCTTVDSAPIMAAPLAIRRILSNVIDNAIRHAGAVTLSLHRDLEFWRVDVRDKGPGVASGKLGELGQPFGRIEPSRDRSVGGAGLGLAIVRALVAGQGGTVSFANHPEGGFLVRIRLPAPGTA